MDLRPDGLVPPIWQNGQGNPETWERRELVIGAGRICARTPRCQTQGSLRDNTRRTQGGARDCGRRDRQDMPAAGLPLHPLTARAGHGRQNMEFLVPETPWIRG